MVPDLTERILYRDGLVLVLDKPAGINVHPGPRDKTSLEAGFAALRFGLPHPPVLAHRLDRDTSGCLVLARHPKAARKLGRLFAEGRVGKTYWAVVRGAPPAESGRIDLALAKRSSRSAGWRMVADPTDPASRPALTEYRVLGHGAGLSLLELVPHTGRTHQIRVHCASLGCPVLGDPLYGGAQATALQENRAPLSAMMHLHARRIVLPLSAHRAAVTVTAPLPAHVSTTLACMGLEEPPETDANQLVADDRRVP